MLLISVGLRMRDASTFNMQHQNMFRICFSSAIFDRF